MSQACTYVYPDREPAQAHCYAWAVKGTDRCRHHRRGAERPPGAAGKPMSFLERIVWDALQLSRCPPEHRYQGPGKGLPCRWCRTAHAVMLALEEVKAGRVTAEDLISQLEDDRNWTLRMPPAPKFRAPPDKGCSVCQRKPGEPKTSWCTACR